MIGFLAGVGAGAIASRAMRRRTRDHLEARGRDPACEVAIVLFVPNGASARLIDLGTQSLGFSHACLKGCEVDEDGAPILLDCRPGHGVHRRHESYYEGRARSHVIFTGPAARELYGCARGRVGADFAQEATGEGFLCSEFVATCLPGELRGWLETPHARKYAAPGGTISPNQIAAAFGAIPGLDVVVY